MRALTGAERLLHTSSRSVAAVALRLRPNAVGKHPSERSVLDDIAARRPWSLLIKAERLRARLRLLLRKPRPGCSVLIINWNTREVTLDTIHAVQSLSPPGTTITVIDNGSVDGSVEAFQRLGSVTLISMRTNIGHGNALDLGMLRSPTEITVALDSDAVPLSRDWLQPALDQLVDDRVVVAGLRASRGFVHPVYAAVQTEAFIRRGLSFQRHVEPGVEPGSERWGVDAFDVGELLSLELEQDEIGLVPTTPNRAKGLKGMTAGDAVYHHGGVSRSNDASATADETWTAALRALGVPARPSTDRRQK